MNYYDNIARHGQFNLTLLLPLILEACIFANLKLFLSPQNHSDEKINNNHHAHDDDQKNNTTASETIY
jgi:hypothetical protein